MQAIIVSTAIIHNICMEKNDIMQEESLTNFEMMQDTDETYAVTSNQSDQQYRQQLIDTYFSLLLTNGN